MTAGEAACEQICRPRVFVGTSTEVGGCNFCHRHTGKAYPVKVVRSATGGVETRLCLSCWDYLTAAARPKVRKR